MSVTQKVTLPQNLKVPPAPVTAEKKQHPFKNIPKSNMFIGTTAYNWYYIPLWCVSPRFLGDTPLHDI